MSTLHKIQYNLLQVYYVLRARYTLRKCSKVGEKARVYGAVQIYGGNRITIGNKVRLRGTHVPVELASVGGSLTIGDNCFINSGCSICSQCSITIGNNVAIGNYTLIMDTDFHNVEDHSRPAIAQPVTIEDDAWIAARVTILKGVTIGAGAVVAAGAVVTSDVPPRTVVGGVPARILRRLDADKEIDSKSLAALRAPDDLPFSTPPENASPVSRK